MNTKKFALLVVVALVLACIPVIAGAVSTPPNFNDVHDGDTKITGTSVDAMTITATRLIPAGSTSGSVHAAGSGATWTLSSLPWPIVEGQVIRLNFTYDAGGSGWKDITVVASYDLNGQKTGGSTTTTGTAVAAAPDTSTAGTDTAASASGVPATGDARPMLYFAGGLFIVGLALALLTRAMLLRRQEA
ncbi:MAG: hypothetical protein FWF45_04010 [Coriobacteriia bacterium]|nr:hypothetical protein [Coriobacteriia bacterium]